MKNDRHFLKSFIRGHKAISAIIIFCVFVALLIGSIYLFSWMSTKDNQLSAVGAVIVEVVSIALGLILAFSYDAWIKRMDLEEDKKNILLGIKQELGAIINKINDDDTLSEILSQKTYYSSILSSDSVQKILDTTHFHMISELYKKMEHYYSWFSDRENQQEGKIHLLDRHFSEIFCEDLKNFDYSDWLKLLCQILFLSNHSIEKWVSIKRDYGIDAIVRKFEISSFNFIDDASIIERQNLLAQIFPKNGELFQIANLRNLNEMLPIDILNLKRQEYLKRHFYDTSVEYEHLSNHVFDSAIKRKSRTFRIIDRKFHKELLNKNVYIYYVEMNDIYYVLSLKINKESLLFSWITLSERSKFFRNVSANG